MREILYTQQIKLGYEKFVSTKNAPKVPQPLASVGESILQQFGAAKKGSGQSTRQFNLMQQYQTSQIRAPNEMEIQRLHSNWYTHSPKQHVCLRFGAAKGHKLKFEPPEFPVERVTVKLY